eukprot:Opistho-2@29881
MAALDSTHDDSSPLAHGTCRHVTSFSREDDRYRGRLSPWPSLLVEDFATHATAHGGTDDMDGESRDVSDMRDPSKLQPSIWSPPSVTLIVAPETAPPRHDDVSARSSIEHFIARAVCCRSAFKKVFGWNKSARSSCPSRSRFELAFSYHPPSACVLATSARSHCRGSSGPSQRCSQTSGTCRRSNAEARRCTDGVSSDDPRMTLDRLARAECTDLQSAIDEDSSWTTNACTGGISSVTGARRCCKKSELSPTSFFQSTRVGPSSVAHFSRSKRSAIASCRMSTLSCPTTASLIVRCIDRSMFGGSPNSDGRSFSGSSAMTLT